MSLSKKSDKNKIKRGLQASLTVAMDGWEGTDEHGEVVSVFESKVYRVHTSHSWDFLGVSQGSFGTGVDYAAQQDVIVGVIDTDDHIFKKRWNWLFDVKINMFLHKLNEENVINNLVVLQTGIWPDSKSFSDAGMGPVPQRFKGQCVPGRDFTLANCNRQIIGARYYHKGFEKDIGHLESVGEPFYLSARDADGHGTHTASTAAGAIVTDASFMGLANGTARGGAPAARLAIYKACWFGWCSGVDLLAAFDDAISDGVDIISVSAAPDPPQPSVFSDAFSIGGFHAFLKGILTCVSAGNKGPLPGSATNVAPWLFTVAASSIDRRFESELVLGDQVVLKGESLAPAGLSEFHDLIDARNAAAPGIPAANASFCLKNSLDPNVVTGKIVLCAIDTTGNHSSSRIMKSIVVQQYGGVGMVLFDPFFKDLAIPYVIPTTVIGEGQYPQVLQYMATQGRPIATIRPPVSVLRVEPAPQIAAFSSRGPNTMNPDIIKPDITAPGLNILAAWSPVAVSGSGGRPADFNIISGTSMSCPHVSGAAALIKSRHPSWSPAAIKSALMTTATLKDNTGGPLLRQPHGTTATPFDFGSGHLNPIAALDPGLVYELDTDNLIDYLCSTNATQVQLLFLIGSMINCANRQVPAYNLNYPSVAVAELRGTISVSRTLTNYGESGSVYTATIGHLEGVNVKVTPDKLNFTRNGEKLSYRLDFTVQSPGNGDFTFGYLTWSDGKHNVGSPIAVNAVSV
ncbi:Subtilisin-like protease SBT5-3 [Nymphaea thermarum]|nr:Subtilisin-like protease SBT5-3 [Nymphaea thermarum]